MRLQSIRISGYRLVPFCASCKELSKDQVEIKWGGNALQCSLPTTSPMVSALIGANSTGKSTLLQAIGVFFKNPAKLSIDDLNQRSTTDPVIIEVSLRGSVQNPSSWHATRCSKCSSDEYELTIARVWTTEGRTNYIRTTSGVYEKMAAAGHPECNALMPEYRLIASDVKPGDEVNPAKGTLLSDLLTDMLTCRLAGSNRSIIYKLRRVLDELGRLSSRQEAPNRTAWRAVEELEMGLSEGVGSITPVPAQVRFVFDGAIPSLDKLFHQAQIRVDDGVELDLASQGLGMQRSLAVSALRLWSQTVGHREGICRNYLFAIEEPELYLHPHAIRYLLALFATLAESDQLVFTTHSSEFLNRVPLSNILRLERQGSCCHVTRPDLSQLTRQELTKVQRYMMEDRSDMLFARAVLLVEGQAEFFAIPEFASRMGLDLDRDGVSVVFVNGKHNFTTYYHILRAFGIPHVILGDGDGEPEKHLARYSQLVGPDSVFVLKDDFEHLIACVLSESRLLAVINECRDRRGQAPLQSLPSTQLTAANLKSQWWDNLKEQLNSDIPREHRSAYDGERLSLQESLLTLAERVIQDGHIVPTALESRRAEALRKEGKPLAGRVLGEMLSATEVQHLDPIAKAVRRVVALARPAAQG